MPAWGAEGDLAHFTVSAGAAVGISFVCVDSKRNSGNVLH